MKSNKKVTVLAPTVEELKIIGIKRLDTLFTMEKSWIEKAVEVGMTNYFLLGEIEELILNNPKWRVAIVRYFLQHGFILHVTQRRGGISSAYLTWD